MSTEDEMVGWHHGLDECEFEQTAGVGDGQGSLACCSPWGCKELDTIDQLNRTLAVPFPYTDWYRAQKWRSKNPNRTIRKGFTGTSQMVQWSRLRLPVQGV